MAPISEIFLAIFSDWLQPVTLCHGLASLLFKALFQLAPLFPWVWGTRQHLRNIHRRQIPHIFKNLSTPSDSCLAHILDCLSPSPVSPAADPRQKPHGTLAAKMRIAGRDEKQVFRNVLPFAQNKSARFPRRLFRRCG